MTEELTLTNDSVHEAYYEETSEVDKIKYNGVKVWPKQGEEVDLSRCLQFNADRHCSINMILRCPERHV